VDALVYSLKFVAAAGAMVALVPLIVWGATGNWRHALYALRRYLVIMAWLAALGGGLGLLMALQQVMA
jgi:hypothetical protein